MQTLHHQIHHQCWDIKHTEEQQTQTVKHVFWVINYTSNSRSIVNESGFGECQETFPACLHNLLEEYHARPLRAIKCFRDELNGDLWIIITNLKNHYKKNQKPYINMFVCAK